MAYKVKVGSVKPAKLAKPYSSGTNINPYLVGADLLSVPLDMYSQRNDGTVRTGASMASGVLKGAAAGAMLGPLGIAGGAFVGGATSLIKANQQNKAVKLQEMEDNKSKRLSNLAKTYSDNVYLNTTYPTHGIPGAKQNYYPLGGVIIPSEEGDINKIGDEKGYTNIVKMDGDYVVDTNSIDVQPLIDRNQLNEKFDNSGFTGKLTKLGYKIAGGDKQIDEMNDAYIKATAENRTDYLQASGKINPFLVNKSKLDDTDYAMAVGTLNAYGGKLGDKTINDEAKIAQPVVGQLVPMTSNTQLAVGNTHANGGIDIGQNEIEGGEVLKGDKVYSDRLYYDKVKGKKITFAEEATRISGLKAKSEANLNSTDIHKRNTAERNVEKYNTELDTLFGIQEAIKNPQVTDTFKCGGKIKYPYGGNLGSPKNPSYYSLSAEELQKLPASEQYKAQGKYKEALRAGKEVLAPIYKKEGDIPYEKAMEILSKSNNDLAKKYFDAYWRYNYLTGNKADATGTTENPTNPIFGQRHYDLNLPEQVVRYDAYGGKLKYENGGELPPYQHELINNELPYQTWDRILGSNYGNWQMSGNQYIDPNTSHNANDNLALQDAILRGWNPDTGLSYSDYLNNTGLQYMPTKGLQQIPIDPYNPDIVRNGLPEISGNTSSQPNSKVGMDNNKSKVNLSNMKLDTNEVLANTTPFIDNIVNAYLTSKTPKIPKPNLIKPADLKTNYNINPELVVIDESVRNTIDKVRTNTSSSNMANQLALAANVGGIKAKRPLYAQKENIETQLKNAAALNAQQIEGINLAKVDAYDKEVTARKAGILQDISKNVSNLQDDFTNIIERNDLKQYQKEQLIADILNYQDSTVFRDGMEAGLYKDVLNNKTGRELLIKVLKDRGTKEDLRIIELINNKYTN